MEFDRDLQSIQEVRNLITNAKKAQEAYASFTQAQVDHIVEEIAKAGAAHAEELAKMAVEETGFGVWQDKILKNLLGSTMTYDSIKDMKTVGIIREDPAAGIFEVAVPMGVVAALIPSTNPTSTVLYKSIISLKAGNAIVISPHPNAKKSILRTVEIVKDLYRGADILILDEPTAVLTPQETDKLFAIMRNMKADGKSLIIITHKLHEVLDVSDRVAVLRKGEYIGDVATKDADQQSLTDMMVGHTVSLNINRPEPKNVTQRLVVDGLTVYDELGVKRLDDVSFTVNAGEVLGIAGVAGSGQRELLEAIAGLYPVSSGHVTFYPPDGEKEKELVGLDPMKIRKSGISMSFVPEDRLGMGLVGSMGMTGNMMLRSWRKGKGLFLDRKDPEALANRIWEELGVVTPSTSFPVRRMSGGNVQKVLVGREIAQSPAVLMTAYAVRGLDINTSYTIYNLLTEQKMKGVAVVYVGEDLDVLLELCDRIVVLCGGQVSGVVDARKTDKREVGALMTLVRGGNKDE